MLKSNPVSSFSGKLSQDVVSQKRSALDLHITLLQKLKIKVRQSLGKLENVKKRKIKKREFHESLAKYLVCAMLREIHFFFFKLKLR